MLPEYKLIATNRYLVCPLNLHFIPECLAMMNTPQPSTFLPVDNLRARSILAERLSRRAGSFAASSTDSAYLQDLYRMELLTPNEERCLFERLSQLKVREAELSELQDESWAEELACIQAEMIELRNHLVESNLRLVVSVAKKFRNPRDAEYQELLSEGNNTLLKAVDLFDVSYGYRFSTYATTALRRTFMNYCNANHRRQQRFVSGQTERFDEIAGDAAALQTELEQEHDVRYLLDTLNDRERMVVVNRFGLNGEKKMKTFREIGEAFQLSKERIRQILMLALGKMKVEMERRRTKSSGRFACDQTSMVA